MKALRCHAFGPVGHLALEEDVASPVPSPQQAVVTVRAAGVNFPDTLIVQGKYQIKPELPFTPGAEFAGVIKAIGEGVANVKPGDSVFGVGVTGGFAEETFSFTPLWMTLSVLTRKSRKLQRGLTRKP